MITPADIEQAVQGLWRATPLAALVPGGLWFGRVPAEAVAPYAQLALEAGDPQLTSGTAYWQSWAVRVSVWAADGLATAEGRRIEQELGTLAGRARAMQIRAGRVLGLLPAAPSAELDASLRDARDACIHRAAFALLVQGSVPPVVRR